MYRIPENLREENSSQCSLSKVAIWSLFRAILGETPEGTPGRGQNLGKLRFTGPCARKIREIYENARGNQRSLKNKPLKHDKIPFKQSLKRYSIHGLTDSLHLLGHTIALRGAQRPKGYNIVGIGTP